MKLLEETGSGAVLQRLISSEGYQVQYLIIFAKACSSESGSPKFNSHSLCIASLHEGRWAACILSHKWKSFAIKRPNSQFCCHLYGYKVALSKVTKLDFGYIYIKLLLYER